MRQRFYRFLIRSQYSPRERQPKQEREENDPTPPQSLTRSAEAAPPEHCREMREHQQQGARGAPYMDVPQEGDERLRGDHVLDRPMRLERRGVVVLRQHDSRYRKKRQRDQRQCTKHEVQSIRALGDRIVERAQREPFRQPWAIHGYGRSCPAWAPW